ncbi:MAG TPA: MarR family transcriptional regulator [Polyangiales bacterium]|nr:MarR family transcriptional regulator [Polyangiales bacterium]
MAKVPLARLFAMSSYVLVSRLHERLEAEGFRELRPAFAFVLLASRDGPLTGNDIARFMDMTKQAASKLVDAMEQANYLVRKPHPEDARAKLLHISAKGKRVLEAAERIYVELEAEWARVIGAARVSALRRDLIEVLEATHGGKLPPIRPAW